MWEIPSRTTNISFFWVCEFNWISVWPKINFLLLWTGECGINYDTNFEMTVNIQWADYWRPTPLHLLVVITTGEISLIKLNVFSTFKKKKKANNWDLNWIHSQNNTSRESKRIVLQIIKTSPRTKTIRKCSIQFCQQQPTSALALTKALLNDPSLPLSSYSSSRQPKNLERSIYESTSLQWFFNSLDSGNFLILLLARTYPTLLYERYSIL